MFDMKSDHVDERTAVFVWHSCKLPCLRFATARKIHVLDIRCAMAVFVGCISKRCDKTFETALDSF